MTLVRWRPLPLSPTGDLLGFQEEVNHLFDGFFGRGALRGDLPALYSPAVDIEETADSFVVRADLPGMNHKDVKVNLMGDTLTVRGERKPESERKDRSMHRVERVYGGFERSFTLGMPVRNDKVKATYRDGVLEITVPKAEEARLKEVEVQVGS